jgi:hypothetical protein
MTPKLVLLISLAGAVLWLLRKAQHRIAGAVAKTAIEIAEAVFWGYTIYLLIAIPLQFKRLENWPAFFRLLGFIPPVSGIQVLAILAGISTATFRFFEAPRRETRRPDEHIRGSPPLPRVELSTAKEAANKGVIDKLRRFLERLARKR